MAVLHRQMCWCSGEHREPGQDQWSWCSCLKEGEEVGGREERKRGRICKEKSKKERRRGRKRREVSHGPEVRKRMRRWR